MVCLVGLPQVPDPHVPDSVLGPHYLQEKVLVGVMAGAARTAASRTAPVVSRQVVDAAHCKQIEMCWFDLVWLFTVG